MVLNTEFEPDVPLVATDAVPEPPPPTVMV
jgi:hypothetical protein